jgi:hypothetical protein
MMLTAGKLIQVQGSLNVTYNGKRTLGVVLAQLPELKYLRWATARLGRRNVEVRIVRSTSEVAMPRIGCAFLWWRGVRGRGVEGRLDRVLQWYGARSSDLRCMQRSGNVARRMDA